MDLRCKSNFTEKNSALIPLQGPVSRQLGPSLLCVTLGFLSSLQDLQNFVVDQSEGHSREFEGYGLSGKNHLKMGLSQDHSLAQYLPKHQQGRPERTAPTISGTWAWRSILVFQTCTNVLLDT